MPDRPTLGIVREWKTATERRVPVVPDRVRTLVAEEGVRVLVESSPHRVFPDAAYREAGAEIVDDLEGADLVMGIKEMPIERLHPGRPHVFFSHTIKGQVYNMPLLERLLASDATLIDYELVVDARGKRMIFFGVQAGQAGMLNALWTLGRRLVAQGVDSPFATLRQAREHDSLDEACQALDAVRRELETTPLPESLAPIVVGVTGSGNVAHGAQQILGLLKPKRVAPEELLEKGPVAVSEGAPVLEVRFTDEHYAKHRDGRPFDKAHYRAHPEEYLGRFEEFLPHLSLLVTGHYWDPSYPKLVTREALRSLGAAPRLLAIGDVTCDPDGSIESTTRPTLPDDPVYVYDPATGRESAGFEGPGVAVMAVDILPSEIPLEASQAFDAFLGPWLLDLLRAVWSRPLEKLALPAPWQQAVIAHQGRLAPAYAYLEEALAQER